MVVAPPFLPVLMIALHLRWFSHHVETSTSSFPSPLDAKRRRKIWELLARSEGLDRFLGKKFPNLKRYGQLVS